MKNNGLAAARPTSCARRNSGGWCCEFRFTGESGQRLSGGSPVPERQLRRRSQAPQIPSPGSCCLSFVQTPPTGSSLSRAPALSDYDRISAFRFGCLTMPNIRAGALQRNRTRAQLCYDLAQLPAWLAGSSNEKALDCHCLPGSREWRHFGVTTLATCLVSFSCGCDVLFGKPCCGSSFAARRSRFNPCSVNVCTDNRSATTRCSLPAGRATASRCAVRVCSRTFALVPTSP